MRSVIRPRARGRAPRRPRACAAGDRSPPGTRRGARCSRRRLLCPEPRVKYAPFSLTPGSVRAATESASAGSKRWNTPSSRSSSASRTRPRSGAYASSHFSAGQTQSFMPMSRSESMKTGVWKRSARSNAFTANSKHSRGVRREEQDVLGVAVRRVGAAQDVAPAACASASRSTARRAARRTITAGISA